MEDQRKIKSLVEGIAGIFFLFFAINQYFDQRLLVKLSHLKDYETTRLILILNYWIMIIISFSLISLAIYDSKSDKKTALVFIIMFVGSLAIIFPVFLNNMI